MLSTPNKQQQQQQQQKQKEQHSSFNYAHACKCIAGFFVVAGVVLMFFETGIDPQQKLQVKQMHQLSGVSAA